MKEKFNKRILASGAAVLLVFGVIGSTLAFLQDWTETIENHFTYGEVSISLTEAVVNEYGEMLDENGDVLDPEDPNFDESDVQRTDGHQIYKLIPGHTYVKDPVVTVEAGSEDCYVYLLVDNPIAQLEDFHEEHNATTIYNQMLASGWSLGNGVDYVQGNHMSATQTLYWRAVSADDEDQDFATFTTLTIEQFVDVSAAEHMSIDVTAFAVQQDGFASAEAAWFATFGQRGGQQGQDEGIEFDTGQARIALSRFGITPDINEIDWSGSDGSAIYSVEIVDNALVVTVREENLGDYGRQLTGTIYNSDRSESEEIRIHIGYPAVQDDHPIGDDGHGDGYGGLEAHVGGINTGHSTATIPSGQLGFTPDITTLTWNGSDGSAIESAIIDGTNLVITVSDEVLTQYGRTLRGSVGDGGSNTANIFLHIENQGGAQL